MIDYLEQLERDLVEAIDRRGPAPSRPRRHARPRRLRLAPVAAAGMALLMVAIVITVVRRDGGSEQAVSPKLPPAPITTATPSAAGFELRGELRRTAADTWQGAASGPGGRAILTITGIVDLSRRDCCGSPQRPGSFTRHVIRFAWTTPQGTVEGCVNNGIYRRPHGRWVWDGVGRIMRATGALRRYRDLGAAIAGRTAASSPERAQVVIAAGTDPPPERC